MTDTIIVVSDNTRDLALETLAAARGRRPESVEPIPGGQRSRRRIIDTYVDEPGER